VEGLRFSARGVRDVVDRTECGGKEEDAEDDEWIKDEKAFMKTSQN
jgi:hypothetical protein